MFTVSAHTVKNLYRAQQQDLRGVLRLDISSGRRPADLTTHRPNLEAAREAVGERVLRLLKACAADAVLLAESAPEVSFAEDAVPPPPDRQQRTRVVHRQQLEAFVIKRLDEVLGLDPANSLYPQALEGLVVDLLAWARRESEETRAYGIVVKDDDVFVRYQLVHSSFSDLEPA